MPDCAARGFDYGPDVYIAEVLSHCPPTYEYRVAYTVLPSAGKLYTVVDVLLPRLPELYSVFPPGAVPMSNQ